jgi:hypothetical protein
MLYPYCEYCGTDIYKETGEHKCTSENLKRAIDKLIKRLDDITEEKYALISRIEILEIQNFL